MKNQKFVLSTKAFSSLKEAEEKATGYFNGGQLKQDTKCFLVVKSYKPVVKFKEINL